MPIKVRRPRIACEANAAEQTEDDLAIGTGPERLAPWWPLLEQLITAPESQAHEDLCQENLPLTKLNLEYLNHWARGRVGQLGELSWDSSAASASSGSLLNEQSPEYPVRLRQNGVLPPIHSMQPKNWRDLDRMIRREAEDGLLCPGRQDYERWLRDWSAASSLGTLLWQSPPLLNLYAADESYHTAARQPFHRVSHGASFNAGLHAPCPDLVQGIGMADFGHVRVEMMPGAVLSEKTSRSAITLAHVAGALFEPSSVAEWRLAEARISHAGAAMVYGRNNALRHLRRPDDEGHAHVLTFVTDGATIVTYAHHVTESTDRDGKPQLQYHQYPILSTNMKASYADFRRGWAQMRNCQQYAFERCHELRRLLKRQHRKLGAASWAYQGPSSHGNRTERRAVKTAVPRQSKRATDRPVAQDDDGDGDAKKLKRRLLKGDPVAWSPTHPIR